MNTLSAFAEQCKRAAAVNVVLAELAYRYVSECLATDPKSRPRAIKELASEMCQHRAPCVRGGRWVIRANGLVRCHALVVVFGEALGELLDGLPWHMRFRLAPLIRRDSGASCERWHALPGLEDECRGLALRAARGEIHRKALTLEVNRLRALSPRPDTRTPKKDADCHKRWRRRPQKVPGQRLLEKHDHPLKGVALATPKDAASMLAQAVSCHPDADNVARGLLRHLMRCEGLSERFRAAVRTAVAEIDGRVAVT